MPFTLTPDPHDLERRMWECERCPRSVSMGGGFSPGPEED